MSGRLYNIEDGHLVAVESGAERSMADSDEVATERVTSDVPLFTAHQVTFLSIVRDDGTQIHGVPFNLPHDSVYSSVPKLGFVPAASGIRVCLHGDTRTNGVVVTIKAGAVCTSANVLGVYRSNLHSNVGAGDVRRELIRVILQLFLSLAEVIGDFAGVEAELVKVSEDGFLGNTLELTDTSGNFCGAFGNVRVFEGDEGGEVFRHCGGVSFQLILTVLCTLHEGEGTLYLSYHMFGLVAIFSGAHVLPVFYIMKVLVIAPPFGGCSLRLRWLQSMLDFSGHMTIITLVEVSLIGYGGEQVKESAKIYRLLALADGTGNKAPSTPVITQQGFQFPVEMKDGSYGTIGGRVITKVVHNELVAPSVRNVFNRTTEEERISLAVSRGITSASVAVVKEAAVLPEGVEIHTLMSGLFNELGVREDFHAKDWVELVKSVSASVGGLAVEMISCPGLDGKACTDPTYDHVSDIVGACTWVTESL